MSTATETFPCFGGRCSVRVEGEGAEHDAAAAVADARRMLLIAHGILSRFDPDSELSRLNRDPRPEVPASRLLRRVVAGAVAAGLRSGGLVDATLVDEIEAAGYAQTRDFGTVGAGPAPPLHPAAPDPRSRWCELAVDERAGTVIRPPGLRIDPGGIAKGLMADEIGEVLADYPAFAVDCCGDLRVGGVDARTRTILVDDPRGGPPLHELRIAEGAVATSGITRRSWVDDEGRPAHQILDPATGRPAYTGVLQATAVAPTGLIAETLAKSALLVGPGRAASQLPFGGVVVEAGGRVRAFEGIGPLAASGLVA
ncbi:MAG TPA: FAD:protein FMN transferase [Solirubrobacterales bacterium]|nr:FAD:protein FMN transferase [Solirubrobacterales bacterium]